MSDPAQLARLAELADHLDRYVADRPELALSQLGMGAALVVGAIRSDPDQALDQLQAIGRLASRALAWVELGIPPEGSDLLAGLGLTPADTPA